MERNKNANLLIVLTVMVFSLYCASCKKDQPTGAEGDEYIMQNLSAYNQIPSNGSDTIIPNLGLVYPGKVKAGFVALLAGPLKADVEITAKIDHNPKLLKVYDSLYRAHSPDLPDSLFKLSGAGRVSVKAGQVQSMDSIKIALNNTTGLKTGNYTFTVPIALESVSEKVKLKSKLMFLRYSLVVSPLMASLADASGGSQIDLINTQNLGKDLFLSVTLNRSLRQDFEVNVEEVSTKTFVDAYNGEHGTSYLPFPSQGYVLLKNTGTIPAGSNLLNKGIQVQLKDLSAFSTTESHLLGLRIKDKGVVGSLGNPKNNTVYIAMFPNNIDLTNTGLTGAQIDRSGWKVSASDTYSTNIPENVLDGDNQTIWRSGKNTLPQWLQLEMDSEQMVNGFSIVPNYSSRTNNFIQMTVLSSKDGKFWKPEGEYIGKATIANSSASNPDIKTIKFIRPVTARYFMFKITKSTSGRNVGMAELYGIK